jgi:hypothetical protein
MASDNVVALDEDLHLETKVDEFCQKYQVNSNFVPRLEQLKRYKIVLIADDSGSMRLASDAQIEGVSTRWDELKLMCKLLVELYSAFNDGGIDIHFLNRKAILNVKDEHDSRLFASFAQPPAGPTPICNILQKVLDSKIEKPKIVIIATDGCPTGMDGKSSDVHRLKNILSTRDADANFVSIVACTGDDQVMAYLNRWDIEIPNLDVTDDYVSERTEIWRAQGEQFGFGYADYVIKLALGCTDRYFDRLDELTPQRAAQLYAEAPSCCAIL